MSEINGVDEDMIQEIRNSVKDTADRGLIAASKCKRNAASNPKSAVSDTASMSLTDITDPLGGVFGPNLAIEDEMEAERFDADALMFSQRCMSMKEYNRAAYHTQGCRSSKAFFVNVYSKFLVSEKRALLEWHNEDNTRMQPLQPVNKEISDLLAELENTRKNDPFLQFLKALFCARMSRVEDARKILCESLSKYPWNWSAWTLLGTCVDSTTLLHEIISSIKLPPKHPLPRMFQIKLLNELQSAADADISLCDHLLSENWFPNSLWVMSHRARALYGLTYFQRAEEQFETLLKLDPDRIDDVDIYSNILYALQQEKKLTLLAERFMKKDKNRPEVCCIVGNHYSLRCEHDKAVKYFRRATQLDRTCFHAWTLLGHEYLEMTNAPAAIESYRVALAINTKDYRPWFGLGQAYTQLGLPTYALYYYQKASYLRPSEYVLWDGLGECYEQILGYKDAIECYHNAAALQAGSKKYSQRIALHVRISTCYKHLQNLKEAAHQHYLIVKMCDNEIPATEDSSILQQYTRSMLEVGEFQATVRDSENNHCGNLKQAHDYLTWVLTTNPLLKSEDKTRIHGLLNEIAGTMAPKGIVFNDKYPDSGHGYDTSYRKGPLFLYKNAGRGV
ncbi:Anaphase-promoting complex subunit 8 [Stygiomarasmius scandens]|uniref:Anaphase-promoting complex subunit 8 n=1 Tax=Marasmiellus scandens TaxID=2682957 RepID=A0ABR1K8U5_9AGAR